MAPPSSTARNVALILPASEARDQNAFTLARSGERQGAG
jgi:hypothetical protein